MSLQSSVFSPPGFLLALATVLSISSSPAFAEGTVHKVADPFNSVTWKVQEDSTASGSVMLSRDLPTELSASSKNSVDITAVFSGTGFEFFKSSPFQPLVIPGNTKKVSLWVRNPSKYGWTLQFQDGWGRSEVAGKKLEWNISQDTDTTWKKVTFDIPTDWVQPISIAGVVAHNWENQTEKASVHLFMDQMEVDTDLSNVDEATGMLKTWQPAPPPANPGTDRAPSPKVPVTPLLTVSLRATELHNVFSGVKPQFRLTTQNWHAAAAKGNLKWKITDSHNSVVVNGAQTITVEDNQIQDLPLDTLKYGVYRLDSTITWADGKKVALSQLYAVIPVPRPLTDAEKDASPYGLNVLSARQPMVSTFRKAGIVWFRDYGFNYEWMVRAKGTDNKYAGWPYYPRIMRDYEENGARVLANFQTAMHPPANGVLGPNTAWTKEIVGMMLAFPYLTTFELDNEYDLNGGHTSAEEPIAWKNYGLYHKKFGDVAQLLGDGKFVTVENGRAGIWPERLQRMVNSGDFATIDVVNSHHYAGVDPPETNVINHNMGFAGDETVMSFFDQLRAAKKAGSSDGKQRQHWLTEFGWDTKAGPVVSPVEQAAYLARAYMLLSAAGTEKGFWFWDLDSPQANQFFDGCGLFTYDQMPKLSYAAFAGLTQILPKPEYLGTINAGPNTWGYLFRNEGKLVAALWTLDGKPGPKIDFGNAKVYDYFANPLASSTVALGIEPVYAVGISPTSPWYRQAAYSLESHHLISVTAGDTVTADLQVKNTRNTAINGKVHLQLPTGWTDTSGDATITVAPGQTTHIPLRFRVSTEEPLGEKTVDLMISEGEPLHAIPLRVQVQRPIMMTVTSLKGEPGNGDVRIRISNRSTQPFDGTLRLKLPSSWSTTTPEIRVDALKPMEVRDVPAKVQWAANWKEGESAMVEYRSADGRSVQQPLIPNRLTVYSAPELVMDGDLKDWPIRAKLPDWVQGSTLGDANANVYLAWSAKGLYVGVEVHDSKGAVPDPRNFWTGDVLELFVDTRDKKTPRKYEPGDHQFWLVPLVNEKRVYVGQWKRNEEIPATRYDIPGIQGAAVRKGNGYVMECLIPASQIVGFKPTVGTRLGLSLNLSVKGAIQDREVFWTTAKSESADQPSRWGTITLAN